MISESVSHLLEGKRGRQKNPYFHEHLPIIIFSLLYLQNPEIQRVLVAYHKHHLLQAEGRG